MHPEELLTDRFFERLLETIRWQLPRKPEGHYYANNAAFFVRQATFRRLLREAILARLHDAA